MSIRILIVDDHAVVRQGLRMFLAADPEFQIVGEACDGAQALVLARELKPDLILMDLLMPNIDGIGATATIHREMPEIEVLALTSVLEDKLIVGALRAGAIGYLLKDMDAADLRRAVKAAAAGQVQIAPDAASRLAHEIRAAEDPVGLTHRETEILRLLAQGQSNKEIAQSLRISDGTVKSHLSSIFTKIGVTSRTQAVLYAIRIGLVSSQAPD
jgi:two-component system, NarL family, response regulator LiaR